MTTRIGPSRAALLSAVTLTVTLATTGCHVENPDAPTPPTAATNALDELKSLPSLEETTQQVRAAMNEIASAATKVVPELQFLPVNGEETGNCEKPYEQTDGKRLFLPDEVASGQISEANWTTILAAAKAAAAKLGATDVQVMKDAPANHDVWFEGPTGIFIKIAYRDSLVVSGYTGCRLPQDRK